MVRKRNQPDPLRHRIAVSRSLEKGDDARLRFWNKRSRKLYLKFVDVAALPGHGACLFELFACAIF